MSIWVWSTFRVRILASLVVVLLGVSACSTVDSSFTLDSTEPTVAGVTTINPEPAPAELAPSTSATSTTASQTPSTRAPERATGLAQSVLVFGPESLELVASSGKRTLLHDGSAIRVEGDLAGGVVFQESLADPAKTTILWHPARAEEPTVLLEPPEGRRLTLHGIADLSGVAHAVYSTEGEGEPGTRLDQLSRINLETGAVTNLASVRGDEFGSRSTQVDGQFIVTTWRNDTAAGWTVYQARSGQRIGGSIAALDQSCTQFPNDTCAALAAISANGKRIFRILPKAPDATPGQYRLVVSLSENGKQLYDIDLENGSTWWPEHVVQVGPNTVLLSRSSSEDRLQPFSALVVDLLSGQSADINLTGFARLPG